MNVVHSHKGTIFIGNTAGPLLELFAVLGRPPIAEVAFAIELAALVVKAMGQFVANHDADSTEVYRIVFAAVEEGRLQDSGGEVDVVFCCAVVGIDGG